MATYKVRACGHNTTETYDSPVDARSRADWLNSVGYVAVVDIVDDDGEDRQSFEAWFAEVDRAVYRIAGVSVHDLSDACYWDAWSAGTTPADMAREALQNDGLFGGML